ncbi:MAG: ribose-phosphate pyrophosphokinase [Gammaproteobacteria bacterium]
MPNMMLFTGNANPMLAAKVADCLKITLGKATVSHFRDGETMVEILENVRGRDVFVLQPTCSPANQNIMELIIMADALRRASASRITAVVPYFGYARQDRRVRSARVPITAKVVADLMTSIGISRLLTVDLHADQIQGFFHIPVDNIYSTPVMLIDLMKQGYSADFSDVMVISPDVGGVVRARAISKHLGNADMAIIDKRRAEPNQSEVMSIIGDPNGRHCIIIDDIVDTAGTLCSAAEKLKENGAKTVSAYITHPVFSGSAIEKINSSVLDQIVVTNTIPLSEEILSSSKIRCVCLAELLAQTIRRINSEESVSSLFTE